MSERKVRMSWALLIVGLVIASLNLRPALAGVSPVLDEIMGDLGLSAAGGGAITTVMVICLGVLGPLAPLLARRFGLDRTLMAGLLILAAGVVLRSAGSVPALYVGAAVSGTAIGIMNVAMPGVVKQHFPPGSACSPLFTSPASCSAPPPCPGWRCRWSVPPATAGAR
ncbi:MFS transporter [Streptosporangium lutulentum]